MAITFTGFKKDVKGSYIVKDPGTEIIYSIDWSQWLETSDDLATSTFTVVDIVGDAANLTISSQGINAVDQQTYVELAGGTAGETYTVKNTITTDNGITDVRRFRVRVEDRYL